jgi:uncharacterized protein YndB with AHSA1/START domain
VEPLQVIAAPRRLRILELVWDREMSAGDIAAQFEVSWSAVSQHLRVLKDAAGEFVEVDPPRRLVFTWGWTNDSAVSPGSTRVVVTLHAENGGTRVVLRHHGLPEDGQRDHHRKGWELYLDRLGRRIRGDDPGPDPAA